MKETIYIIVSLLLLSMPLHAQDNLKEAVERQLLILQKDSNNMEALKELGMLSLKKADFDNGIHYGNRLQHLVYSLPPPVNYYYLTYSHVILGQGYTMRGERSMAYNNLQQAKVNAESLRNDTLLCSVYNGLGLYEANLNGDYEQAIAYFYQGLELAQQSGYIQFKPLFLANLSVIYYLKNDATGLPYAEECYEYGHEHKNIHLMRVGAETLAQMHYLVKNHAEALNYIQEAEFLILQNDFHDQADMYALYGMILSDMGKELAAIGYFEKAFQYASTSNASSIVKAYTGYVNALMKLKRYEEAARLLQKGEDYIRTNNVEAEENKFYQTASMFYEQQGQYEEALHYHKIFQQKSDALFNITKEHILSDLKVKYGFQSLEIEIEKANFERLERERNMRLIVAGSVVLLCIACVFFFLYRRTKRLYQVIVRQNQQAIQRERELVNQIDALQSVPVSQPSSGKYVGSSLSDEKGNDIYNRLEQLMVHERIYTDNMLTKEKVSELLGTNRTYLSQIINEQTGKTFTQYVNEFRAREAVHRLSDPQETLPLKALLSEVGFNSIATFNSYFQAQTGMTPAQYRNSVRGLSKK